MHRRAAGLSRADRAQVNGMASEKATSDAIAAPAAAAPPPEAPAAEAQLDPGVPGGDELARAAGAGAGAAGGSRSRTPGWLRDALLSIETNETAEKARLALRHSGVLNGVPEPVWSALRGDWFGHALHPPLTQLPLGSWVSATVLDATGVKRMRPAATALVAVGLASAPPAAWSGVAEWRDADERSQRVGVVHAALNSGATICYATSLVLRLTGRHRRAVWMGALGGGFAAAAGYLGGHLAYARRVGSADPTITG